MGHIHVKSFEIWTSGSGGDAVKGKAYGRADGRRTKTDHNSSP